MIMYLPYTNDLNGNNVLVDLVLLNWLLLHCMEILDLIKPGFSHKSIRRNNTYVGTIKFVCFLTQIGSQ